jgi:hypothetical protein
MKRYLAFILQVLGCVYVWLGLWDRAAACFGLSACVLANRYDG